MSELSIAAPAKGDPITAAWAQAVTDAVNAAHGADESPDSIRTPDGGLTSPPPCAEMMEAPTAQAMPFDTEIIREDNGNDALYMALPNAPDYVFDGSSAVSPDNQQTMGTAQSAWVRIETVTNDVSRYVSLALTLPDNSTSPPIPAKWRLFVDTSPTSLPSWADPAKPVVLLAGYNIATDNTSGSSSAPGDVPSLQKGLVQYHRGTINIGTKESRRPFFLECRIFTNGATDASGNPVDAIRVYIGPDGSYPSALRINGKHAPLSFAAADLDAEGWLQLGMADAIQAVWLVPKELTGITPKTYYNATNWGTQRVEWTFDTYGDAINPGSMPAGVPNYDWPRWMHPLCVCVNSGRTIVQGIVGGTDISVEVGDADGTHSGYSTPGPGVAGGFCSVEQNSQKQLQFYGFQNPNLVTPTSAMVQAAGIDLVIRQADYSGQGAASITMARVRYMALYELLDVLRTIVGDDWWSTFQNQLPAIMDLLDDYSEQNNGPFWRSGGDAGTCYGEDIADSNGNVVIDLDACELIGAWIVRAGAGSFTVDGDFDTTGNASVGVDLSVAGTASVNGSLSAGNDITSGGDVLATGKISGSSLEVNGDTYVPQQITYLDGNGIAQTITVLKKQ